MKFITILPLLLVLAAPVFAEQKLETLHEQPYEYQISKKDTLWGIALKIRPKKGQKVSPNQVMFAILRKNPDVFEGGNIHFLKPESLITVPSLAEVLAEPSDKANEYAVTHEKLRKKGRKEAPELYPVEAIETQAQDEEKEDKEAVDEEEKKDTEKEASTKDTSTDTTNTVEEKQEREENQTEQASTDKEDTDSASEGQTDLADDKTTNDEAKTEDISSNTHDFSALQNEINAAVKSASEALENENATKTPKVTSTPTESSSSEKTDTTTRETEHLKETDQTTDSVTDPNFDLGSAISDIVKSAETESAHLTETQDGKKEQDTFVKTQKDAATEAKEPLSNDADNIDTSGFIEITKDDKAQTSHSHTESGEMTPDTSGFVEINKDDTTQQDQPNLSNDIDTSSFVEINKDEQDQPTPTVPVIDDGNGDADNASSATQTDKITTEQATEQTTIKKKTDVIVEDSSLLEEKEDPSYLAWIITALAILALLAYAYYRKVRKRRNYRDSDQVTQRRVVAKTIPKEKKIEGDDVIPNIEPASSIIERQGVTGLSREQPIFKEDIDVKLKLALAYLEVDNIKEARQLLTEVSLEGDLAQQRDAQVILARLSDAGVDTSEK